MKKRLNKTKKVGMNTILGNSKFFINVLKETYSKFN